MRPHTPSPWGHSETHGRETRIYGAWVWRVPRETSEALVEALSALEEFPPPQAEGWRLVHVEPGRFKGLAEARDFVPEEPGVYVVTIGKGRTMEWEIVRVGR